MHHWRFTFLVCSEGFVTVRETTCIVSLTITPLDVWQKYINRLILPTEKIG